MQSKSSPEVIADKPIHDEFIIDLNTPKGFPYCPPKLIGMMRYLRDIKPLLEQRDNLIALTDIIEKQPIDPARKTMLTIAIDQVFSSIGNLTADFSKTNMDMRLRLLTGSLDTILKEMESKRLFTLD
jgi:hypothetical protein